MRKEQGDSSEFAQIDEQANEETLDITRQLSESRSKIQKRMVMLHQNYRKELKGMCVCMYVCMCVCIHVCMHVCMSV